MIRISNRYISTSKILFFLVDTSILLGSTFIGYILRFGWDEYSISMMMQFLLIRSPFFALVFQLSLFYFELYDLKIIRAGSRLSPRFVQSIAATLIALMISYYMLPNLYLGRGVLLFTVSCAIPTVFLWRIVYRSIVKANQLNERIIILGTGQFAKEIAREIREKGDSGFEIIGHIHEQKESGDGKHTI